MVTLKQMLPQQIDYMPFNSYNMHTHYKINTTIGGQVISAGKLVVKAQYFYSMQEHTNWYCKKQPIQQTFIFSTRTIIHPRLEVIIIIYVQDIPKNLCGMSE